MTINASTNTETVINNGDKQQLGELLARAGLDAGDVQALTCAIDADGGKKPVSAHWNCSCVACENGVSSTLNSGRSE
jgi:hypothetical protein